MRGRAPRGHHDVQMVYHYVGPPSVAAAAIGQPAGTTICQRDDVLDWVRAACLRPDPDGTITVTFVVADDGQLRIADRHSEHVACAGGQSVLAAGEMVFRIHAGDVRVTSVSNQSTGYCPEPGCWPAVSKALQRVGFDPPGGFAPAFEFRRCTTCGTTNLIKDGWLECGVCSAPLPSYWNFRD